MSKNKERFLFNKINIIGLGLMGGSIAKACKKYDVAGYIYGFDDDKSVMNFAIANKIIDEEFCFDSTKDDLTIIACPLSFYEAVLKKLKINNSILIDIGSLKSCVIDLAENILKDEAKNFIACHPIAGSDKSSIHNCDGDLFLGKKIIISKTKNNLPEQIKKIELFWQKICCDIDFIDAKEHDKIFALVSHLPQFIAFIAKDNYQNGDDEVLNRHFRLQNSSQKLWQEIFDLNGANLKYYLGYYLKNIDLMIEKLKTHSDLSVLLRVSGGAFLQSKNDFDEKENLNQLSPESRKLLLKRIFLVLCFFNLPDIKKFQIHSGSGFQDFIAIFKYSKYLLTNTTISTDERLCVIEFLHQIKSKIYESFPNQTLSFY